MSPRKSRLRFSVRVSCSLMMRRYRGAQRTRWTAGQHSSRKTNFLPGLPTSYFLPPSQPSPTTTTPWRFKNNASLQSTDPPSLPPRSLLYFPPFTCKNFRTVSPLFFLHLRWSPPPWMRSRAWSETGSPSQKLTYIRGKSAAPQFRRTIALILSR